MNQKIYSLSSLAFLALLFACYPEGPQYVDELDITYTNHDTGFDFSAKSTYSLPNKVVKITGDPLQPPEYIKDTYGLPMLARIDADMQALGWTKVDINSNPDVQFLPAAWESTTVVYSGYYSGYYCWYYYYYCGGGGWYYPYYPSSYSYSTGTLLMTMIDPNQESADGNKRVVWTGAINGLLGTYDVSRVNTGIDQAFTQSPYLKTN